MTGLASRKITTAALLAGSLAVGVLAPTAAGAFAPGQDHGTAASTAASAPASSGTPSGPSAARPSTAKPGSAKPGSTTATAAKPGSAKPGSTTAAYVKGKVVSSVTLRIRSRATTNSTALGSYAPGAVVKLACKVRGQNVGGNDLWYNLSDRPGWLAARYVQNLGAVPFC